jgi:hypothetical protein
VSEPGVGSGSSGATARLVPEEFKVIGDGASLKLVEDEFKILGSEPDEIILRRHLVSTLGEKKMTTAAVDLPHRLPLFAIGALAALALSLVAAAVAVARRKQTNFESSLPQLSPRKNQRPVNPASVARVARAALI